MLTTLFELLRFLITQRLQTKLDEKEMLVEEEKPQ